MEVLFVSCSGWLYYILCSLYFSPMSAQLVHYYPYSVSIGFKRERVEN